MSYNLMRRDEFERAAMPHTESLLRTALRLIRDRADAEDMVQETLLHAWRAFDQFERGTNCKAWLFRILFNISSKRRQKLRARPATLPLDGNESLREAALRALPPQATATEVLSALDTLSEEHRVVLMLAVVEGFTCKEIAHLLAVPVGTVMSRLSRARAELRKVLTYSQRKERSAANAC